jgi:hypothetical protein
MCSSVRDVKMLSQPHMQSCTHLVLEESTSVRPDDIKGLELRTVGDTWNEFTPTVDDLIVWRDFHWVDNIGGKVQVTGYHRSK